MADLITRQEYKSYVGINSDNQNAVIDALIPKVSELVKSYCGRGFNDYVADSKIEIFSGGTSDYFPKEYPIIRVISLETSDNYGQDYTDMEEFVDYVIDEEMQSIKFINNGTEFPKLINGYKLSYFAGYEVLPEDLKLVVFDLLTYYIKNDAVSHMQKTTASGTLQLEYMTSAQFPSHIARVLNLYKANWD